MECENICCISAVDEFEREIVSISSSHDNERTADVGLMSMTMVFIDLAENYKDEVITWREFLEKLGFGINCYLKRALQSDDTSPLPDDDESMAQRWEMERHRQRPQLGSQTKLDLDQKFTLDFA